MTAGDIALLIGAVAGLVTAFAGLVSAWQRKAALDADKLEAERNQLRIRLEVAMRHIHDQDVVLATHGIDGPATPNELRAAGPAERPQ